MSTGSDKNQSKAPAASLATTRKKKGPRPVKRGRRKGDGKPLILTCEDWYNVRNAIDRARYSIQTHAKKHTINYFLFQYCKQKK